MPFVDSANARIHYLLEGPPAATALVLSNSLGANLSMWDPQLPEFKKHFRVLRYDTRGHGQSSATPGPYSIERLARDVLALLDALGLDRIYFCGLSLGGMIGMWLAANAPARLQKLVLCSTAVKIGNAEIWNARIEAVRKSGMKPVAAAVVERWFSPAFREKSPDIVAGIQKTLEETNPDGYASCCAAVRDFDFHEKVSSIHTPTLVISATHDPATTPADGHFLETQIHGARYTELSAAHLSNVEASDRFTRVVAAFLSD